MTELIETHRGTVYPWQCDHMNHMNVMWYVGKFDEGTWNFFNHIGLTPSFLRSQGRGMAAVDQRIAYKRRHLGHHRLGGRAHGHGSTQGVPLAAARCRECSRLHRRLRVALVDNCRG